MRFDISKIHLKVKVTKLSFRTYFCVNPKIYLKQRPVIAQTLTVCDAKIRRIEVVLSDKKMVDALYTEKLELKQTVWQI